MKKLLQKMKNNKKAMIAAIIICAAVIAAIVLLVTKPWADGQRQETEMMSEWEAEAAVQNNRFAGVVESADAWNVTKEGDSAIKEFLVEEGETVKKGTPLFTYDVENLKTEMAQEEIELSRMQNEYESTGKTIEELKAEKKRAASSEQANYTIQIQEQELALKQAELDIDSKKKEIEHYKDIIDHATVKSEVAGVVKTINKDSGNESMDMGGESSDVLISISQTDDLHVKGTVNELNIKDISEGMPVIVHSRVDDSTWSGVVDKLELEQAEQEESEEMAYGYGEDSGSGSTDYPFYVTLESSDGLMIGQHVYMEIAE